MRTPAVLVPGSTAADDTIWIASYPKSGNTWLRFLLYGYFWGYPARSIDINDRIPDAHRPKRVNPRQAGNLWKTHHLVEHLPTTRNTRGAIYIHRNPLDVFFSAVDFHRLQTGCTIDQQQSFALEYIRAGGPPAAIPLGFGTWSSSIDSWTSTRPFPVHVLSYEALHADASGSLRDVIEFLGVPLESARLDVAVAVADFDAMRSLERTEKDAGQDTLFPGRDSDGYFMNRGQIARPWPDWARGLEVDFFRRFADPAARLGYHYT